MSRARLIRRLALVWPALAVLSALGLVFMPVDYRGGAGHAHAHAFLHFVMDLERGDLVHHHAALRHHHPTGTPAHQHVTREFFSPEVALDSDGIAMTDPTQPDVPTSSTTGSLTERMPALGLIVTVLLLVDRGRRTAPQWPALAPWRSTSITLEPPPPRVAAAIAAPIPT